MRPAAQAALLRLEQLGDGILLDTGTDDAQSADGCSTAVAHIRCAGYIVIVNPLAVRTGNDALRPQNQAIGLRITQCFEGCLNLLLGVGSCCLSTPALEHLIGMVMVLVVVVMAAAGAVRAVVVMMVLVLLVVVMMMVLVLLVVVMMVVLVLLVVVMMVVLLVLIMMVVMVMVCGLLQEGSEFIVNGILLGHGIGDLLAGQRIPVGRDDGRLGILLTQALDDFIELVLAHTLGMGEDQAGGIGDLVVEEFTEILLVHLALLGIDNGREAVKLHILHAKILHGTDDIRELADTGRLDQDAVGMVLLQYLLQRLAEVTDERAADAAGVHLRHFNAGILQKAAVNADLAEFIFNEHQLLVLVSLCDQLLDERRLTGTEKSGKNGNLCHTNTSSFSVMMRASTAHSISIPLFPDFCKRAGGIFQKCLQNATARAIMKPYNNERTGDIALADYLNIYDKTAGAAQPPQKKPVALTVCSILTLAAAAVSLLFAVLLMIIIGTTVSNADSPGLEMFGYIGAVTILMLGSWILSLIGVLAGLILTIVTAVCRHAKLVWMPALSMLLSIGAFVMTMQTI